MQQLCYICVWNMVYIYVYLIPMTIEEIFELITSKPKWYAGLRDRNGKYYNAQSANRIKDRFRRRVLTPASIEKIFNSHGYYATEISWIYKPKIECKQ